jgi:hypothetical protein
MGESANRFSILAAVGNACMKYKQQKRRVARSACNAADITIGQRDYRSRGAGEGKVKNEICHRQQKRHVVSAVLIACDYCSAPHIHRHKELRIKLTEHHVEIFLNLERLAIHLRCR